MRFEPCIWTYALSQIVSGWLVDQFDVYRIFGAAFLMWPVATALTGLSGTSGALLGLQFSLGIGESVAFPAYSRILVTEFSERRRALMNSLVDIGAKAGLALGMPIGGLVVAHYGWKALFISLGVGGLLWIPLLVGIDTPSAVCCKSGGVNQDFLPLFLRPFALMG